MLAENDGKWIGKGKNDIKEITNTLRKRLIYQKGIHSFELELAMRKNDLLQDDMILKGQSPDYYLENISDIVIYLTKDYE